jgi:hypothetical protein
MSRFFCHVVLICSGSMLGCVSTTIEPRTDPYDIALDQSDEPARSDLMYLMNHMSRSDLDGLGPERALHHAATMRQAWQEAPWADDIDESLWRAAILPPTHVSEACEDWCDTLHVRLDGIGTSSLTVRETVRQLNAAIGDTLGVHYHPTKRRAPDQGPLETIESGWSSCTGLSILLANSCRMRGIPARLAGTPLWLDDSGNHTWVEVWADGSWHFVEAADPSSWDTAWFAAKAAEADSADPMHRIYAVMPDGPHVFPMSWDLERTDIRGEDVTARYK